MAAAPSALGSRSRRPAVLVVAALTQALVGFDLFAVTVALPKMAVDLGATTIDLSWVVSGFAIGLAGCVVPGGRLGERFGYRLMLVGGLGVFGVGALLAGMATTPTAVVVARVLQGGGAGVAVAVSVAGSCRGVRSEDRGGVLGRVFAAAVVGSVLGPVVGGLLTEWVSWRLVFWIEVPVGVVVGWLGWRFVVEDPREGRASSGAGGGARVPEARGLGASGDRRWWRPGAPGVVLVAGVIATGAFVTVLLLVTASVQEVRGLSPVLAGVVVLGAATGDAVGGLLAGRFARFPYAPVLAGAVAVGGAGIGGLTVWSGWVGVVAALVACGLGMGMVWAFVVASAAIGPGERAVEAWEVVVSLLVGVAGIAVVATARAVEELFGRGRSLAGSIELGLRAWVVVSIAGALLVAVAGSRAGRPAPSARSAEVGGVR